MKKIFVLISALVLLTGCYIFDPQPHDPEVLITFDVDGGEAIAPIDLETLTTLPQPSKTGYTFHGWFLDPAFSTIAVLDNITESVTLYAKWEEGTPVGTYYIVFFLDFDGVVIHTETVLEGNDAIGPQTPQREGYEFTGWDQSIENVSSNLMVTAQYTEEITETFTVIFMDYDGIILKSQSVVYGENATPPANPTREGHTFMGWDISYHNITTNRVITALYEFVNVTYTITFDTRGGNPINTMSANYGDSLTSFPTPTRDGYTFLAWSVGDQRIQTPFVYEYYTNITLEAIWLEPYSSNGTPVYYLDSQIRVMMPDKYTQKDEDFRAMWVSNLTGDVSNYQSQEQMMGQLNALLDDMEAWNMNAIVYHVRTHNNALYDTTLSPKASYVANANFSEWDYLEWFIEECHKRDIEFHAWLNPYRLPSASSASALAATYAAYPLNPASNTEYLLPVNSGYILNPGEPYVREFLVDTCMEIIQKYDVDAIHFDDYFYAAMNSTADSVTYNKYKANSSTTNIDDWRREQVSIFIYDLSVAMRAYNQTTGRTVELGISPTGAWKNGDGVVTYAADGTAITSGSKTRAGLPHYSGYLYADTKLWIDEEWIDYIVPQTYWSFTYSIVNYAEFADWWAKVVRYKDVKLYMGMGIYMTAYGWANNPYEASDQVLYNTKHPEIDGVCIFRYNYIKSRLAANNAGTIRMVSEYWSYKVPTPK